MSSEPQDEPLAEMLNNLVGALDAGGVFDEIDRADTAQRITDPEWSRPRCVHVAELLRHAMYGIQTADTWHIGYTLPPHFTEVVNGFAARIEARWPGEVVVYVSVFDFEQMLREWIAADPRATAWNDGPGSGAVSRHTPTALHREFMDLGALTRNAAVSFLKESDRDEAFSRDFDARWEAEHGKPPFTEPTP